MGENQESADSAEEVVRGVWAHDRGLQSAALSWPQEPFLPCRPPPRPPSPCSLGWAPCSSPALSPSESPSVPLPVPVPLTHRGGCQTGNPSLCRPAPISWEETHCRLVAFLLRNPRFPVGVGFCRPIPFSLPLVSHLLGPLPPPLCWCPSLIIS